jgi:hypothetical protein
MTAEIAILNRAAVALAADSVVTLSGGLKAKTYDSAEKIFELSRFQPIALMIYNNAQFMNAPLEIVARRYRETLTSRQFVRLEQVWPAFEKFLLDFKRDFEDELVHFKSVAISELSKIRALLTSFLLSLIGKETNEAEESPSQYIIRQINIRRDAANENPLKDYLDDVKIEDFKKLYGPPLMDLAARVLQVPIDEEMENSLLSMMFAVIKSDQKFASFTGLVFAGFGADDIFPTLNSIEIDGFYFGKFRILSNKTVDIDMLAYGQQAGV